MKNINLRNNNITNFVNFMLTGGGAKKPYNISVYEYFNNKTIDKYLEIDNFCLYFFCV